MPVIYTKTRELTIGPAGTALSIYHLTAHQNIDAEIQDISTALSAINYTAPTSATMVVAAGNLGSSSANWYYSVIGKTMCFTFTITVTTGGAFNFVNLAFTLPAGASATGTSWVGHTRFFRSGVGEVVYPFWVEGTVMYLLESNVGARLSGTNPIAGAGAWATGDRITGSCTFNFA